MSHFIFDLKLAINGHSIGTLQRHTCKSVGKILQRCFAEKNMITVHRRINIEHQLSHQPRMQMCYSDSYRNAPHPVSHILCSYNFLHSSNIKGQKLTLDHEGIQRILQEYTEEYNLAEKKLVEGKSENLDDLNVQVATLGPLLSLTKQVDKIKADVADLDVLLKEIDRSKEAELVVPVEEEKKTFMKKLQELEAAIIEYLTPQEEIDDKDLIIEVTAGVGGQEAMLFTKEIFEMYFSYASWKGWNCEILHHEISDIGGLRHASLSICGENACKFLKFEAGVHRVQRIPLTEKSGRIHTSTVTVAVLPQPTEIDIVLNPKDLKIETKRSSGPGGQHVNTTDSCVRITHLPTGIMVESQRERSQHQNKEFALRTLKAKLYKLKLDSQMGQQQATRKLQVGTASRSEKVRTYNFAQDRITDHRHDENLHGMKEFLSGKEKLDELINTLIKKSQSEALLELLKKYDS